MENSFSGRIYLVTCLVNDKVYVGQTSRSLERRWAGHVKKSRNPRNHFHLAIQKYGKENFKIEELESFVAPSKEELKVFLDRAERSYIEKYNSLHSGYNSTVGGEGTLGFRFSDESKEKLRRLNSGENNYNFGKHLSDETKEKIRKARMGHSVSEETKRKISESEKGKGAPLEQLKAMNDSWRGKHHLEETKKKMSLSMKGKKHNMSKEGLKRIEESLGKRIIQFDLNGNLLKVWPSIESVSKGLNLGHKRLHRIIKNGWVVFESRFQYEGK